MTRSNKPDVQKQRRINFWISLGGLVISASLLFWSLRYYRPAENFYGPRAIYSLLILSVALTFLGRWLLFRLLRLETSNTGEENSRRVIDAWRPLFLFDITAPVYLAAGVLIGRPAAVLVALITQILLQLYTVLSRFISWTEASYRVATTALLVFISDSVYVFIARPSHALFTVSPLHQLALTQEFIGVIASTLLMMCLLTIFSLPLIMRLNDTNLKGAWQEYTQSPVLRFQALVLSVGPLLPIVNIFDDVAAELAWLFFLIPLFAIYYLALISTRLSVRTNELQRTVQELHSARRRQGELRDYASLVTRVQEEERRRLARELHDDTAQALIALSLGLDGLGRAITRSSLPAKDRDWLVNLQYLADRTLEGVRRACRDLRPSVLDDLGLRAALEWLADTSSDRGTPCVFTCIGTPVTMLPEVEIAIFRIVQEALSNIWRHSKAHNAKIELTYLKDLLQVVIIDDGIGFDNEYSDLISNPDTQSGLGLIGMRERAILIEASLKIQSSPGHGCRIELAFPIVDLPASAPTRQRALEI